MNGVLIAQCVCCANICGRRQYIGVVASDFKLFAFGDEITFGINTGIYYRLASARACAFYFIDCIGYFKESARAFKQMCLKIGSQSITYNVAAIIVYDTGERSTCSA